MDALTTGFNQRWVGAQEDDYNLDFENAQEFVEERMEEIWQDCRNSLDPARHEEEWDLIERINSAALFHITINDFVGADETRLRNYRKQRPFVNGFAALMQFSEKLVEPHTKAMETMWGLLFQTFTSALQDQYRWKRISEAFETLRRQTHRLMMSSGFCQNRSELQIEWATVIQSYFEILTSLIKYLRTANSDINIDRDKSWRVCKSKVEDFANQLSSSITQFSEMAKLARARQGLFEVDAHPLHPTTQVEKFEHINNLDTRNEKFVGREEIFRKLEDHLQHEVGKLRTHTIYGQRGVGKSEISIEYGHRSTKFYDVIILIRCETAAALRESFNRMAVLLKLQGANLLDPHEENLLRCQEWLRETSKKWLLIYDNAERDVVMKGYWPRGHGAVLITSRTFFNFNQDTDRKGTTVPAIGMEQRWDILFKNLFASWWDRSELAEELERPMGKLLEETEGLGLGVVQIASLINAEKSQATIPQIYVRLEESKKRRKGINKLVGESKSSYHLDSIYGLVFEKLSPEAQKTLGVLCLLAPDSIPLDLFLPQNQDALGDFLHFCKQEVGPQESNRALAALTSQSTGFINVLDQLYSKHLLKRGRRSTVSLHRNVAEAFYTNNIYRQESFDAASRLVYESFPKQINGRPLVQKWSQCNTYIQHALSLANKYQRFRAKSDRDVDQTEGFIASEQLTRLFCNVAWYLLEIDDLAECRRIIEIGLDTCDNTKFPLLYAHLLNTRGLAYFYLNDLNQATEALEESYEISSSNAVNEEELAASLVNLGNVRSAKGDFEEAIGLLSRARDIYSKLGDESSPLLIRTYMNIARTHSLSAVAAKADGKSLSEYMALFDSATRNFERAEGLIRRTVGTESLEAADLYIAFGTHERAKMSLEDALDYLKKADSILGLGQHRLSFLYITTCYKIGCVEADRARYLDAMTYLDSALERARNRNVEASKGHIARILNKKVEVDRKREYIADVSESREWKREAEEIKYELVGMTEDPLDEDYVNVEDTVDDSAEDRVEDDAEIAAQMEFAARDDWGVPDRTFDDLVCAFHR